MSTQSNLNNKGRPTRPYSAEHKTQSMIMDQEGQSPPLTSSGSKGLAQYEPLLFEIGRSDVSGVDFEPVKNHPSSRLGKHEKTDSIGLVGLSEPETLRHYVRLSQKNYAIDLGVYPLGSCTMKHNPRLNEKIARLEGFSDIHPLQPVKTVQGALELMNELAFWLKELTGMPAIALSPKAGAQGELCGMKTIQEALKVRGELESRNKVLVPAAAHGTNPSTAHQCGFKVVQIEVDQKGRTSLETFKQHLSKEVAAVMITNPNTCGVFERDIVEIAQSIHDIGGYVYCDGANFNALMGKVKIADLGVDAMHINLHKTFSTPHGGGGPGAGPTVLSDSLKAYAPLPYVCINENNQFNLIEHKEDDKNQSFGRLSAFHGQMGMFTRALAYMMSHGSDGLKQVSEDAVLNANYILSGLKEAMSPAFSGYCMHESLFDDTFLKNTGITTLDFAKAMIDEGYHPMTMYFPLIVKGAMLIEPTETESKAELDRFIQTLQSVAEQAINGKKQKFTNAPYYAPTRRLDETRAARNPVLKWQKNNS